jgi:integrase
MRFVVKSFIATTGERFSQLYDTRDADNGFPLFYPSAYTSRHLRLGKSHNTQLDALHSLKKLYEWASKNGVDFSTLFLTGRFLQPQQVASLAEYVGTKARSGALMSTLKYNSHLSVIGRYLRWYAAEVIADSNGYEVSSQIDRMFNAIHAHRARNTGSESRGQQNTIATRLSDEARSALVMIFESPLFDGVPAQLVASRYRNVLAIRILYVTGMRIGELLSLRLDDFAIASGGEPATLTVRRYHDDPHDDRTVQPVAKTRGRKIPFDEGLENAISDYLKLRSNVSNVGFGDRDFLLVNHFFGRRQGMGIADSNFRSALVTLQKKVPALTEVHPHLLRHDWNYRFSKKASENGWSEIEECSAREYLMGWVEGSASAALYNHRHVQEKAAAISLQIANDATRKRLT